ncbi:MAG TPA: ATP-binding protein [Bacteroidales bacterium]|nr:ATP-binding protein [Bacteroidales bacterium]HPI85916.1 ATP-binding protein [Bacteroidales bacterium]HPM91255.1 ATP-binding protein [Bacteroidales bacterium]
MFDQKDVFNHQKHLIDRNIDLEKYIKTRQVVIISGIRRCGKSSLLYLIKEKMKLDEQGYCYFNFDDERIIPDVSILEQIYNQHIETYGNDPVLFFDEIQNISSWEKFVNRMYEKGTKIFVTGSNAKLLSSQISTSLTGRNKILELFPFSFSEYIRYTGNVYIPGRITPKQKSLLVKDFNSYFEIGGFPLVVKENDLELINAYFQDILYRDIISRYRLSQVNEIKQIGLYFASNTGKLFSYSTLQNISGVKSLSSIKDYLWYYEQSYLFFYLKKFDYSVKKQIMNPKKVYAIDPAVSNRLGFNFSENKGRILENIVYLELLRRGKEIYYHAGKSECDFLVKEGLKVTEAIQVAWTVDATNLRREIKGLQEAMRTYGLDTGVLIAYDAGDTIDTPDNITIIPAWQWLLEE